MLKSKLRRRVFWVEVKDSLCKGLRANELSSRNEGEGYCSNWGSSQAWDFYKCPKGLKYMEANPMLLSNKGKDTYESGKAEATRKY